MEIATVDGPFIYSHGNGVGGASNSHGINAEEIPCKIPLPPAAAVKVYIEDVDAAVDVTVSLEYEAGLGGKIRSYGAISTGGATAADTEESMGTQTMTAPGTIREIRFGVGNVVDATSVVGKLRLSVPGWGLDLIFAVGMGAGGATLGGPGHADVIKDLAIPVSANQVITSYITMGDITRTPSYSFQVE